MSLFLNKRETAHRDLGHWHFDPTIVGQDHTALNQRLSDDVCDQLIQLNSQYWNSRTAFTSGLYLLPHEDPEVVVDKQEISERFVDKIIDLDKEWFNIVYIDIQQHQSLVQEIEKQLDIVITSQTAQHALKANLSGLRLAVQRPGCITMNHIDHIYGHSAERPSRFDEPFERKIVVFLEDHVPGQYFNIGNHNFHPWSKGQAFTWDWGVPHHACNFSNNIRHNLMISIDPRLNPKLGHQLWK
jgi:hypothetical protein